MYQSSQIVSSPKLRLLILPRRLHMLESTRTSLYRASRTGRPPAARASDLVRVDGELNPQAQIILAIYYLKLCTHERGLANEDDE